METYDILRGNSGWAVSHNHMAPKGSYSTREGAFEAVYLSASNDIKRGAAITITIEPPAPGQSATGE